MKKKNKKEQRHWSHQYLVIIPFVLGEYSDRNPASFPTPRQVAAVSQDQVNKMTDQQVHICKPSECITLLLLVKRTNQTARWAYNN